MKSILDQHDVLPMQLHPEALFDELYVEHQLPTKPYKALKAPLTRQERVPGVLDLRTADGLVVRVEAVAEWGLRIRASRMPLDGPSITEQLGLVTVPSGVGDVRVDGNHAVLSGGKLACEIDLSSGDWRVRHTDGTMLLSSTSGGVRFSDEPARFSGERFLASFAFPLDEEVYGFGGRIAPLRRRGQTVDIYAMKVGRNIGDYGGFPLPYFISSRGYGVFLNNPWPHVYFDMGATDPGQWWVHGPGGSFDLFVIDGPKIPDVVRRFTELVGRIPEPRRWWLGFWTSALAFASTDEVETVGKRLRAEGYPCDGLVLDGPWRGGPEFLLKYMSDGEYPTNDLNWHPDFGDGPGMVRRLGDQGYKVVLHQNSRSWLARTVEKGLAEGTIRQHGRETVVTFGTEAGEKFYHDAIRPRHREGVAMWWLDHGDRVGGELLPGIPSRNMFGALWALVTQRCAEADGGGKQICLIRGAGIGGQRASLPWPGDTQFGIDFFLNDLRFCLSAGLSGFPVTSADLGGFMPVKNGAPEYNKAFDEDNLARRLCHAMLVIPSPRMHQCDTDPPKFPWNCPPHIQVLYRQMLEERYRLTPYYFSYAVRAARTGDPIVRPLVYAYQDDPETVSIEDQCLIGDWLLAAPVFVKGATSRSVYLPRGATWYNWWTGEQVEGGQRITVDAPLCEPRGLPLFVRAGAIIPSQELTPYLTDQLPPSITLDLWPSNESSWRMEEGGGRTTTFVCRRTDRIELEIVNRTGRPRRFKIRCHGVSEGTPLRVNGRDLGTVSGVMAELDVA